jgi:error-prone DNA polymerase
VGTQEANICSCSARGKGPQPGDVPCVHLHVHSAFSFLDGCSYPEELVERAAELGYRALALTDHDNLSGVIRFVRACQQAGITPVAGVELTVMDDGGGAERFHLTLLAATREGYGNICRLVTLGYEHGGRRTPAVPRRLLEEHSAGIIALSGCRRGEVPRRLAQGRREEARRAAIWHREVFADGYFLEMQRLLLPGEMRLLRGLEDLGRELDIPLAATGNVHHLRRGDLPAHDILTCVRTLTRVDEPHPERPFNAEKYLAEPGEMRRRFAQWPQALENTGRIADLCCGGVPDLSRPRLPRPALVEGEAREFLRTLVFRGARERYGTITEKVRRRLEHELAIIARLGCEPYFLTVWDIVREARSRGIRTSGRGSVVDSAVGYCLGISDIDPIAADLPFERFMSVERSQMPDIDVDFPRERRDELVRWVQERYGREHVAGVCTFQTFRARSALREIGKAMGLPEEEVGLLAKRLRGADADEIADAMERQPQVIHQPSHAKRYTPLFEMCARVAGLPRMISTHLAGIVITDIPVLDYTPLQPTAKGVVQIAHFDKDDIEAIALKTDLLSLPILGAVDQAREVCPYESIPDGDGQTFRTIRCGEAIGAFELQSPAQRALHTRVRTRSKKDIIDSIALIRPGPGMGGMTENYIRRRLGLEPVTYIHPCLEEPLRHTYGIIIFQEQVIEVACAAAKFTPGEADILRKMITHARSRQAMERLRAGFMEKARANGLSEEQAEQVFRCIAGFAGYGFAEGHARAFGEIAYRSSYLLTHHPAHYFAGLLNNQPMGFYPPNTLAAQARIRGVRILPVDINRSQTWTTSTDDSIRLGFHLVKGLSRKLMQAIPPQAPFTDVRDFCRRCRPSVRELESLIMAGAFDSLHPNRRALLWQAEMAARAGRRDESAVQGVLLDVWPEAPEVPDFTETQLLSLEYGATGITANCHLVSLLRPKFDALRLLTTNDMLWIPPGQKVRVGGLTLCPHTPPTRSGRRVLFFCLEDEFGLVDVTCFEDVFRASGYLAFSEPLLIVEGTLQKRGLGHSILAERVRPVPKTLSAERAAAEALQLPEPRINASAR